MPPPVSHYKTNLRDIEFNLFEVLDRDEVLGTGPFAEVDGETARSILAEVDRLSREDLAASNVGGVLSPSVNDAAKSSVASLSTSRRTLRAVSRSMSLNGPWPSRWSVPSTS